MKAVFLLFAVILLCSCKGKEQKQVDDLTTDSMVIGDTTALSSAPATPKTLPSDTSYIAPSGGESISLAKVYFNERFKDVTVQKTGTQSFLIKGKAQVFEAAFGWVVEDGHNELKTGHVMTDAGAPAWGSFSFTINVAKQRENSALHLILFEASAKDGSRQHELPVPLY
jgi:hypothetical protein